MSEQTMNGKKNLKPSKGALSILKKFRNNLSKAPSLSLEGLKLINELSLGIEKSFTYAHMIHDKDTGNSF